MVEDKVIKDYTKYEIARIIGARALQLSMNAPPLMKFSKAQLEKLQYDSLKISEFEFNSGVLPITVKRPMPQPKKSEEAEENIVPVLESDAVDEEEIKISTEELQADDVVQETKDE